jgi:hypothetical protein
MSASSTRRFDFRRREGEGAGSKFAWKLTAGCRDDARSAGSRRRAMTVWRSGGGTTCRGGAFLSISSTPRGGLTALRLGWGSSTCRGTRGSGTLTTARMGFLARGGRRRSWRETAEVFPVSGEVVYRSVQGFVEWGWAHRERKGIESMGWDEIHWGRGLRARNFLTVVYQLDRPGRRWL